VLIVFFVVLITRRFIMQQQVFVFGSNLAGRHGKGAALTARQLHGAIYGQGVGLQGRSYAIPTKDAQLQTLPLDVIKAHVREFIAFAVEHDELTFNLTRIGCGLAGYTDTDIAPMFKWAPSNVVLPDEFELVLINAAPSKYKYDEDGVPYCRHCGADGHNNCTC
jgi:hypothetical protein